MRALLAALLLATTAQAAPTVQQAPPASDNPTAMATGAHLEAVCSDRANTARQLICLSWINGASQGNGWFKSLNPVLLPDYCPPNLNFNLVQYRDIVLAHIGKTRTARNDPAIVVFRQALAGAYPCKKG
ncbi:Rap1a/Tai family immunity protein [Sandarakinorhabdus oryzae]|uniref:Rap1a/Tai family immunity protein n=1 Tax=Sandarakinorhabdus oryzae TaxID=2675220 RepID=UPI0012E1B4B9|nr:Rap1a/Tai family immunity protein [Sandarakinorhabdus oryzae]